MMIIKEVKEEINNYLKDYFENKGSYNKIIYDSASYSINIGGKRIRPILMILTYSFGDSAFHLQYRKNIQQQD